MELPTEQYAENIAGDLSCFNRVIITGTLPGFCYAPRMALFLSYHPIRIFDYPRFAEPLRDELRANAERIAEENGLEIEFYFYFIDSGLGLVYVRVPIRCPFRLQIYFKGHSRLAVSLSVHSIYRERL